MPISRIRIEPAMRRMCIVGRSAHLNRINYLETELFNGASRAHSHGCPVPVVRDEHELRIKRRKGECESIIVVASAMRAVEQVDIKTPVICEADLAKIAIEQQDFRGRPKTP